MLNAAEAARRRELHGRAYTPGGTLTDAERAELHDLDNRNVTEPAAPIASVLPAAPDEPVRGSQHAASDAEVAASRDPRTQSAGDARTRDAGDARAGDAGDARALRRRWLLPLVAALAVLVGLGAGWLLFDPGAHRTAMTSVQQDVWSELEASGDYDPGSIHLVGEKYGATAWSATQQGAELTCVVLTRKDLEPATGCRSSTGDYEGFDLQVTLDFTEDGDRYMLFATLIEDAGGNPVTIIQQQNLTEGGWDWRSQYSEDELVQVAVLEEAGIEGEELSIIGYDGATPVWLHQGGQTCLMVVLDKADFAQQCGTLTTDPDMPLQLAVRDVVYSVMDSNRGPSLTILRSSVPAQGPCDSETVDCRSIDDTTGEIG